MELTNNNKLIAEFMQYDNKSVGLYDYGHTPNNEVLKYHESWDWLMPVVQKIGDENLLSIDIDRVYDRVVEFINEHNKYICGSCGDHVNEVVFNEDADVDECTNCTL